MRKAYTLLELIVVLVILGTLATLAVGTYFRSVEQSRSSEARSVLGVIRGMALAHYTEFDSLLPNGAGGADQFNATVANIGAAAGNIPSAPRSSNFFTYSIPSGDIAAASVKIVATRCSGGSCKGGASPWSGETISLTVTCPDGQETWAYSANAPWR